MNLQNRLSIRRTLVLAALLAGLSASASAQSEPGSQSAATSQPDSASSLEAAGQAPLPELARDSAAPAPLDWTKLVPEFRGPTLIWTALVVILVLTVQSSSLFNRHTLDGLVLATACVLLLLRGGGPLGDAALGERGQFWAYVGLSAAAGYWLVRGMMLLFGKTAPRREPNVSAAAMTVLILAAALVSLHHIATAPISSGSRDGIVGGIFMHERGKLPYGDALDHDARSPLLYAIHAGAAQLVRPTYEQGASAVSMTWADRDTWLDPAVWNTADLAAARIVNAALFVLTIVGLALLGSRLRSAAIGQALVAIFCVFPGTIECLPRPEVMLPAMLMTWSLALATVPAVGGVLATAFLILAGLAWPWAWIGLPVLMAYFLRRGWHALGATVGTLGGAAACLAGLTLLIGPTIPRSDGALRAARLTTSFAAHLSADEVVLIDRRDPPPAAAPATPFSRIWRFLVEAEDLTLAAGHAGDPALPTGVDDADVRYHALDVSRDALAPLQAGYRAAMNAQAPIVRMWVAVRTLFERTALPESPTQSPIPEPWNTSTGEPHADARMARIRLACRIGIGTLALLAALALLRGPRPDPRQLIGAIMTAWVAALLASPSGAIMNLVLIMPCVLAALAAYTPQASSSSSPSAAQKPLAPPPIGAAPRISVDD